MKYAIEIQSIRKESKPQILEILKNKFLKSSEILKIFENNFSDWKILNF